MPIEIRELVIRARVEDQQNASSASPANNNAHQRMTESDIQKIVTLCAEEVLKALKKQKDK